MLVTFSRYPDIMQALHARTHYQIVYINSTKIFQTMVSVYIAYHDTATAYI